MEKKSLIYEGKGKKVYSTSDESLVVLEFKDDLTAFNAQKKSQEEGKGELNCKITTQLFELLDKNGVKSHFVQKLDDSNLLCKKVSIIPIEVVVRNIATGSLVKRLGFKEGQKLESVLVEFYLKDDALGDPIINDEHALMLGLVRDESHLKSLKEAGRKINSVLGEFFIAKDLVLVDFKVEFGYDKDGNIVLADEISPDSCRFWDKNSGAKLDKDVFRQDLGSVKVAYEEVLRRMQGK